MSCASRKCTLDFHRAYVVYLERRFARNISCAKELRENESEKSRTV